MASKSDMKLNNSRPMANQQGTPTSKNFMTGMICHDDSLNISGVVAAANANYDQHANAVPALNGYGDVARENTSLGS